jgi:hypothetical protein
MRKYTSYQTLGQINSFQTGIIDESDNEDDGDNGENDDVDEEDEDDEETIE